MHEPVLRAEILKWLVYENENILRAKENKRLNCRYFDGTVGVGGHAAAVAQALVEMELKAWVVAVDRDENMLNIARQTLHHFPNKNLHLEFQHGRYDEFAQWVKPESIDVMLLDLGFNSLQVDNKDRGFSFREEGPLDMRYDMSRGESLHEMLHEISESNLSDVIFELGEERQSRRIARYIKENLKAGSINNTTDLANCVRRASGQKGYWRIDPATRTFQALRMWVNHEMDHLQKFLEIFPAFLSPGGRIGIISFHSIEDRYVKQRFRGLSQTENFHLLTKKPLVAGEAEMHSNPRARSAKLRVLEKGVA